MKINNKNNDLHNNDNTINNFNICIDKLNRKIKLLNEQKNKNWSLFLQEKFELNNSNVRLEEQIEKIKKYYYTKIFKQLLDIIDNFEYTLNEIKKNKNYNNNIFLGINLTYKLLLDILINNGISKILFNKTFDPNKHEAISTVNIEDKKDNFIIHILQNGYMLHDKIIRHSKVIVNKINSNNK